MPHTKNEVLGLDTPGIRAFMIQVQALEILDQSGIPYHKWGSDGPTDTLEALLRDLTDCQVTLASNGKAPILTVNSTVVIVQRHGLFRSLELVEDHQEYTNGQR
ncbi:MAG: hypothetical protein WCT02_02025, partial [Candidatus Paceibacterota bacterium]